MRYATREGPPVAKPEMAPMIDMTFQLIAFFMVVVNFSEADQNERIRLPLSELAKPPEAQSQTRITLQVTYEGRDEKTGDRAPGKVILGTQEVEIDKLYDQLLVEKQVLEARRDQSARDTVIVIRADRAAGTGDVQKVILKCQEHGFESFRLRAQQEESA
jgi:biopolymer transport protein ExbD